MLFLHEVHTVLGKREAEFEAAFRRGWLPLLAKGDDARLLYFLHLAHGSGPSYRVVTWTALRDGAAWQRLVERVDGGDLAGWMQGVDGLRQDVEAKLLIPLPWSPLRDLDLAAVPTDGVEHEPTLFMEDTVWPHHGMLESYVERSGSHYLRSMQQRAGRSLLEIQAGFRPAFGSHRRREVVLWQKVVRPEALVPLLTREVPERFTLPGTWMHDALELRDRWESRLLRTARWSPWA